MSIWLIRATPMRSSSLLRISKPAFRQAFLTWPSTAYSASGIVKLSRTRRSLAGFSLTVSAALVTALVAGLVAGLAVALAAGLAAFAALAGFSAFSALSAFAALAGTALAAAFTLLLRAALAAAGSAG